MSPKRVLRWIGKHFFDKIKEDMLHIKPILQKPDYCGPSTAKMRLSLDGIEVSVDEIAKIAGTTKEKGTTIEGMIKVGEHYGYKVSVKKNSTIDDLRYYIRKKNPPIVDWFYRDDGHYSLAVRVTKTHIYLRDPISWRIRKMPIDEFLRVWFDFSGNYIKKPDDIILRLTMVWTLKNKKS